VGGWPSRSFKLFSRHKFHGSILRQNWMREITLGPLPSDWCCIFPLQHVPNTPVIIHLTNTVFYMFQHNPLCTSKNGRKMLFGVHVQGKRTNYATSYTLHVIKSSSVRNCISQTWSTVLSVLIVLWLFNHLIMLVALVRYKEGMMVW
jgi:hypothetical protein